MSCNTLKENFWSQMKERKDKGTNTEIVLIIKELPEYPSELTCTVEGYW